MSKQTHTPTPWALENRKGMGNMGNVITYGTILIAQVFCWSKKPDSKMRLESKANAEFIVRACNSHEELLEALKLHQRFWDEMPKGQLGKLVCDIGVLNQAFLKTRSAIAKAERK